MISQSDLAVALLFFLSTLITAPNVQAQTIQDPGFKNLIVTRQGSVLVARIDNTTRNLVSVDVLQSLNRLMDKFAGDSTVGALVITGTGDVFSEGGGPGGVESLVNTTPAQLAIATLDRMERFPFPVIAAINGAAARGGLELAMSADIRIASQDATFAQMEIFGGVIPGFGGIQRLPDLVGRSLALDMMITGRVLSASEALSSGLISRTSPPNEALNDALTLAKDLAERAPKKSLAVLKERLADSKNEHFSDALEHDQIAFDVLVSDPEFQARMAEAMKQLKEQGELISKD